MDELGEEVVAEVEFSSIFYNILTFWHTFPDLSPLIWILENL